MPANVEPFESRRFLGVQLVRSAMLERQMNNLTEEMIKIDRSLRRRAQSDLEKIGRRIGRWQGKYPAAARLLEIKLISTECLSERVSASTATSLSAYTCALLRTQVLLTSSGFSRMNFTSIMANPLYFLGAKYASRSLPRISLPLSLAWTSSRWYHMKGLPDLARYIRATAWPCRSTQPAPRRTSF